MEKYDFCEELSEKFNNNIFKMPTIVYRLNGFVEACGLELTEETVTCNESFLKKTSNDNKYDIEIMNIYRKKGYKTIFINGSYDDFAFQFLNTFKEQRVKTNQIIEIPFTIKLCKMDDNIQYEMIVESNSHETSYIFLKDNLENEEENEKVKFYTKRVDIENVFGLLPSFIDNPRQVFETYKEIFANKKVYFNNNDLDSIKYNDVFINDESGKLLEKILK